MWRRGNKYGARKIRVAGRTFDSGGEARRGADLALLEMAGEIRDFVHKPVVELAGCVKFRPDYGYTEVANNLAVVEDFKGMEGERWKVITQLWPLWGGCPLRVSKQIDRRVIDVTRTILPQPQARLAFLALEARKLGYRLEAL